MKDIIRGRFDRPMFATVTDEGRDYLVTINDSAQMTQNAIKGYAKYAGLEGDFPQITCKTILGVAGVDNNNLTEISNFATRMKKQGKENFILPMITQDSVGGSGHTVYFAAVKEDGKYRSYVLNQSKMMTPEYTASLGAFTTPITQSISLATGMEFHTDTKIIAGAFPEQENVASCTEIGAPLLKAMMDHNDQLGRVIQASPSTPLTLEDMAQIRLQGMKASGHQGSGVDGVIATSAELIESVYGVQYSAEKLLSSKMKYEKDELELAIDILAIPIDGRRQEILAYLQEKSKNTLQAPVPIEPMAGLEEQPVVRRVEVRDDRRPPQKLAAVEVRAGREASPQGKQPALKEELSDAEYNKAKDQLFTIREFNAETAATLKEKFSRATEQQQSNLVERLVTESLEATNERKTVMASSLPDNIKSSVFDFTGDEIFKPQKMPAEEKVAPAAPQAKAAAGAPGREEVRADRAPPQGKQPALKEELSDAEYNKAKDQLFTIREFNADTTVRLKEQFSRATEQQQSNLVERLVTESLDARNERKTVMASSLPDNIKSSVFEFTGDEIFKPQKMPAEEKVAPAVEVREEDIIIAAAGGGSREVARKRALSPPPQAKASAGGELTPSEYDVVKDNLLNPRTFSSKSAASLKDFLIRTTEDQRIDLLSSLYDVTTKGSEDHKTFVASSLPDDIKASIFAMTKDPIFSQQEGQPAEKRAPALEIAAPGGESLREEMPEKKIALSPRDKKEQLVIDAVKTIAEFHKTQSNEDKPKQNEDVRKALVTINETGNKDLSGELLRNILSKAINDGDLTRDQLIKTNTVINAQGDVSDKFYQKSTTWLNTVFSNGVNYDESKILDKAFSKAILKNSSGITISLEEDRNPEVKKVISGVDKREFEASSLSTSPLRMVNPPKQTPNGKGI